MQEPRTTILAYVFPVGGLMPSTPAEFVAKDRSLLRALKNMPDQAIGFYFYDRVRCCTVQNGTAGSWNETANRSKTFLPNARLTDCPVFDCRMPNIKRHADVSGLGVEAVMDFMWRMGSKLARRRVQCRTGHVIPYEPDSHSLIAALEPLAA